MSRPFKGAFHKDPLIPGLVLRIKRLWMRIRQKNKDPYEDPEHWTSFITDDEQ